MMSYLVICSQRVKLLTLIEPPRMGHIGSVVEILFLRCLAPGRSQVSIPF